MTAMNRSRAIPILLFVAALAAGGLLMAQRERIAESFSLAGEIRFDALSRAVRAPDGSFAAVMDSNKRVVRIAEDGELVYSILPRNSPDKGFFFANEIAFGPGGELYVASTYLDTGTLTVNREAIVRFSPQGRFNGTLFAIDHAPDDYVDNIGVIRGLRWTPDGLRFCVAEEGGIRVYCLAPDGGVPPREEFLPFAGDAPSVIYATASEDGGTIVFSTAATEVYAGPPGGPAALVYDGKAAAGDHFSIPSDIGTLDGAVYFSDLGRDANIRLESDGSPTPVFDAALARAGGYEDDFFECKSFDLAPGHLTLANNGKVVHVPLVAGAAIRTIDHARGNAALWLGRAQIWALLAALAALLVALLALAVRNATPESRRTAKQVLLVAAMLGTAVGITTHMIFGNMSRRLEEESSKNLRGYLEVGRLLIDTDAVDRIRHVGDYMNEDYQALLAQLRQTITRDGAIVPGTFSGVYKVIGDKLVALAYHDGLRGIFYPYDYQYSKSVYAEVGATGQPYVGEIVDIYGVWLNGVIRLDNSAGEMVGFLEVGMDQTAYEEANRALIRKTLVDLTMVLFVLLFVFTEIGFFSSHVLDSSARGNEAAQRRYDEGALRFVSFLAISGVFLSASFLPLFSKSLAVPVGSLPFSMVVGLPMAIETMCGAVVALLYGHVRFGLGIKTDVVLGCLAVGAGMAVTAMSATFEHFIAGRVVVGMGMGLLMIAFRTYFLIEKDEGRKESGIVALTAGVVAGINVGSVSGGMIAARTGMPPVFWLQTALLAVAAAGGLLLVRNRHRPRAAAETPRFSPFAFLGSPSVLSFFVFAFLPITACGLFLGFLFPLFAEAQGSSTNEISAAFMLFGLGSVYLGPSMTRLTSFLFGARRAIVVGALVMAGSLLVFAHFQTMAAAYVSVALFGLTDSFVFNQGMSFFSSLPGVRRFGADKAMGVYNVFESGGEALGPMGFGLAMSMGLGAGIAGIAGALAVSAGLFALLSRAAKQEVS